MPRRAFTGAALLARMALLLPPGHVKVAGDGVGVRKRMASMNPTGKVVYVCDEVLQDPASGKFSFLGIFDDVVLPPAAGYPFRLGRMCVAAQLVGGSGPVPVRVEIVEGAKQNLLRGAGPFTVNFPTRHQVVTVCFRLLNVVFPASGVYFIELYSQGAFMDDRLLRLH